MIPLYFLLAILAWEFLIKPAIREDFERRKRAAKK